MLRKVLFPTDFSEHSVKVKKELKKFAPYVKELILLNVLDDRLFPYLDGLEGIEIENLNLMGELAKGANAKLEKWKAEFEKAGFKKVRIVLIEGSPFNQILEIAEKKKVTSIFLGHKGMGAVERMLLGSVAEKVARKSNIPVVLVK
ncbi:MAG: universal stress protein [Chlorobi bacterium]|nr:universal stress protein [Chlorobiota bacterium]